MPRQHCHRTIIKEFKTRRGKNAAAVVHCFEDKSVQVGLYWESTHRDFYTGKLKSHVPASGLTRRRTIRHIQAMTEETAIALRDALTEGLRKV